MPKPKRRPSDTKEARRERWRKWNEKHTAERTANRAHLAAAGWDGDAESFITAWRNQQITVRFERKETQL